MGSKNAFRKLCRSVVAHKLFDPFILFMIVFSTILLTLENPLDDPTSTKTEVLRYIDIVVTIIFVIECVLKITVWGFMLNGKESYIRNPWNVIDFAIVIFSVRRAY